MLTGERQVAPELSGIRRDHVARYEFAAGRLAGKRVIDLACGVGYGARILADAGCTVLAIDREPEAVAYGRENYGHPAISWKIMDASRGVILDDHDAAVCFETIEHVADPLPMLRALREAAPVLIASVPNEAVYPYRGQLYHFRHYTRAEFAALLAEAGWRVTAWHGQVGPESEVEPEIEGRTLIAVAERAGEKGTVKVTDKPAPEHVAIIGLGPSCVQFFELTRRLGGASAYCDEVWGINAIGDVLRCDRVFHMDDVKVQEIRAAERPESNIAAMLRWLKTHPGPVYTSVVRPGYPGMVPFPLEDVLNRGLDGNGGAPYFNGTAAYAIAYAVHIGVKRISLFGVDYTFANSHHSEQGRGCAEFWLGIAAARGIEITVPDGSPLLDACEPAERRLYGYDCVDVRLIDRDDGSVAVTMTEKAPPSAADIEARYDHSRHPNPLMRDS